MRKLALLLGLCGPLSAPASENRLFAVDVIASGPCAELRLDCGAAGTARWTGPLLAGEERTLRLLVPAPSAIGSTALASLPLPTAELGGAGAGASVRVVGWSETQPSERVARLAGPLLARPRPPVEGARARPRAAELSIALIAGGFLAVLERRRGRARGSLGLVAAAGLGLASAGVALQLARSDESRETALVLHELDADLPAGVRVRAAREELAAPFEWLEVAPPSRPLEVELGAATDRVRAAGATLWSLTTSQPPRLTAERNDWDELAETWTRRASGAWEARGSWPVGASLPARKEDGASPPGWLASGLPFGRGILLGRSARGEWVRWVGFDPGP